MVNQKGYAQNECFSFAFNNGSLSIEACRPGGGTGNTFPYPYTASGEACMALQAKAKLANGTKQDWLSTFVLICVWTYIPILDSETHLGQGSKSPVCKAKAASYIRRQTMLVLSCSVWSIK
ncbi:unnamed protein product [Ilex paraguariensis]|uniref:Uncharacterized protein n=1 Tax=Ilex paraguariensis TaxID=185542 RepID=A0ABC8QTF1_9AQUA